MTLLAERTKVQVGNDVLTATVDTNALRYTCMYSYIYEYKTRTASQLDRRIIYTLYYITTYITARNPITSYRLLMMAKVLSRNSQMLSNAKIWSTLPDSNVRVYYTLLRVLYQTFIKLSVNNIINDDLLRYDQTYYGKGQIFQSSWI